MPSKYTINSDSVSEKGQKEREDATVDLSEARGVPLKPYAGMTPDDLDRFSNTPFWINLRRISFIFFLISWLALLVSAIAFIIVYKRCETVPVQKWWNNASIYQIYVPSFQDSNGDGLGDIKGIQQRLEELQYLGVSTLVLSSVYEQRGSSEFSLMESLVTNVSNVDSRLGNLSTVADLITDAKKRNMRIVLELPINHVSWNHSWFLDSELRKPGYENFFLWSSKNCNKTSFPNNWQSVDNEPAWTYSHVRQECYYHRYNRQTPDLNWRSALVQHEMKSAMEFWLNQGIDGFLFTSAIYLFEDFDLRNEPFSTKTTLRTQDLPETVDTIKRLRWFVHNINKEAVVLAMIGAGAERIKRYIDFGGIPVTDLAISTQSIELLNENCSAECFWSIIEETRVTSNILIGDMKTKRRLVGRYPNIKTALLIYNMLPGAIMTLYGDEIGLPEVDNHTTTLAKVLTPMRWTNTTNGGFTDGRRSWLPLSDPNVNYKAQRGLSGSNLEFFRGLLYLKKKQTGLRFGKISSVQTTGSILSFLRFFDGVDSFLVVANVGNQEEMNIKVPGNIPSTVKLVADTETGIIDNEGPEVILNELSLKAKQAKLFKFKYMIKEHL